MRKLKRLWLLPLGGLLALVLAEGLVRALGLTPPPSPMEGWLQEDPVLPFRPQPNATYTGWNATHEFDFEIHTNSQGFRDRERSREKPAGAFRIVALGDSFTWGYGAPIEETWPFLLQRRLDGLENPHLAFEVISMGVGRFWPEPERTLLESEAVLYSPDVVVVLMVDNDVYDTLLGVRGINVSRGYLVSTRARDLLGDSGVWMAAHSDLARFVLARMPMRKGAPFDWGQIYVDGGACEKAWVEVEREFERMQSIAASHGTEILFAHVPQGGTFLDELKPDFAYPGRRLARWAERHAAHYVDTWPAVESAGGRGALFWPRDGHPKPEGYRVIADSIFRALIDQGLVQ
jgi:lysophospholipase L1-like esterase